MWLFRDFAPALEKDQQTLQQVERRPHLLVKPGLRLRTKIMNSHFCKPLLCTEHGQIFSSAFTDGPGCFLIIFTF